jgi:MFS family permease
LTRPGGGSFSSLRYRNYRLLWFGNLVSNTGDWMDQISFNWLVYTLTDSAVWLAAVNLCRFVPILIFTLIGGVVADRFERRKMMFVTQSAAMILALLLAGLVATGSVTLWMVMAIAVGRGIMNSFNQPAKQSLVSELVPEHELRNAIALNSAQFNITRVFGPSLGGLLIATVGVEGAFVLNGLSFIAVLWSLALMRFPERKARPAKGGMVSDLVEGVHYLQRTPTLGMLVLLALIPVVLGNPYLTMLTVFARDVLHVGGGGLGLLTSCSAIGSILGAVAVGVIDAPRRGVFMMSALVIFGVALLVFAFSTWLPLSLLALLLVGLGQQSYMTMNNSVVQETVEEQYRGRVMSMIFLNRGMAPLGTMMAGLITAAAGAQWAIGGMAAALVVLALGVSRFIPAIRRLV